MKLNPFSAACVVIVSTVGSAEALFAQPALQGQINPPTRAGYEGSERVGGRNTPAFVGSMKPVGVPEPDQPIEVTAWLNLHNRASLDELARELYDAGSPKFRHWLTHGDLVTEYLPTAAEVQAVKHSLKEHNLTIVRTDPGSFFVRARGKVSDIEAAFQVKLNNYHVAGKMVRANDRDPTLDASIAPLVAGISGLDSGEYDHPLIQRRPAKLARNLQQRADPINPGPFSSVCFSGTERETFTTDGTGALPTATYQGNKFNEQTLTTPGCGYSPAPLRAAYHLLPLYAAGFDGKGQTIGIINWCGSLTIQSDANAFSAAFGLPPLTSANFTITPTQPSSCGGLSTEINLDVEWSHAFAPGAKINLIVARSATFQDVDEAEYTAATQKLGDILSGSYGAAEWQVPASDAETASLITEIAAVSGIAANFSTGDMGDYSALGGPPTVSSPADSPYATAIGGTTLSLNADNSIAWQAGWGNNLTLIASRGTVVNPPSQDAFGFSGGSGGGVSNCVQYTLNSATQQVTCSGGFAKPAYQSRLPGKNRLTPDISWLADPFTGVAILITEQGISPPQQWQVIGGTSVATPMFSALWAIANQEANAGGGAELGQAAPYLYTMPASTISDVVPVTSKTNVKGSVVSSSGSVTYTPSTILGGLTPAKFLTVLVDDAFADGTADVLSFGTDCTTATRFEPSATPCSSPTALHTRVGWDNVTGLGTPDAQAFATYFYGK